MLPVLFYVVTSLVILGFLALNRAPYHKRRRKVPLWPGSSKLAWTDWAPQWPKSLLGQNALVFGGACVWAVGYAWALGYL